MCKSEAYDFLKAQWEADYVDEEQHEVTKAIEDKTLQAMVILRQGDFMCLECEKSPYHDNVRLEGHHHSFRMMYVSEYTFCKKQKFRRSAMQRLWSELAEAVDMLCKICHEYEHHNFDR